MKERFALVLDQDDEAAAELLTELGFARNVARGLVYLVNVDEATSNEIEQGAGLRQPEVSTAMLELRERGWVEKRNVPTEGRGRPRHSYRLAVPLEVVLEEMAHRVRGRMAERFAALEDLRNGTQPKT